MVEIHSKMPVLEMKELKNKNKEDLEWIATGLEICLHFECNEIKDRGWVGEAKGLLQVLWERG